MNTQPNDVPKVIERLRALEASALRTDGVVCFARLYRSVTEAVDAELARSSFADPRFLARLDVVFAELFFTALTAFGRDPASAPSAWAPLFAARARRGIAPLQFAFAGMNAHINRDLPVALVTGLLARVEQRVKDSYLTGPVATLDRILHRFNRIDDVIAMWDVQRAREAAWANAEALWTLRADEGLRSEFVRALDRMVGFA